MLMLCIGLLPATTFAQDAPGDFGGVLGIDGGITNIFNINGGINVSALSAPPASVKNLKRNNGNGTTATGLGEARLGVSSSNSVDYILISIASMDLSITYENTVKNGSNEKSYISYPLDGNNLPAKKLMWIFKIISNGKAFAIAEQ